MFAKSENVHWRNFEEPASLNVVATSSPVTTRSQPLSFFSSETISSTEDIPLRILFSIIAKTK